MAKKTKIKTLDSYINIQDIKVGDKVLGENKEEQLVTQTFHNQSLYILNIELENGVNLKITENHKIFVIGKGWIKAGLLKEDDDIIFIE